MSRRILIVAHMPSPNTTAMGQALAAGGRTNAAMANSIRLKTPFEAQPADLLSASAVILMTTENLGYMSGALKDFFDRCYYPCLEETQAMPYALVIRAGHDGTGTRLAVEKIVTGLRWRAVAEPMVCRGKWHDDYLDQCRDLGQAMAEGVEAGIF